MSRKLSSSIRNLITMDRSSQQSAATTTTTVLSIECLKGTSKADEWTADMLQTGDIVEEIKIGSYLSVRSPFKNGKTAVQKILHTSFRNKDTSITVRVRRVPNEVVELQACIVPDESAGRKNYMLRAIADPNYAVGFSDRTESECISLQASRNSRMVTELTRTKLQDGYVSYPWERRMQEVLPIPTSSSFLSLLLLPKASDPAVSRYNDLEDTLARANAWLNASQASGVPVVFMTIQTESLLTKISGETASSTVNAGSLSDLSNLTNTSMYGFEDYHGVDLGVVRAVRLWFAPLAGEVPIEIKLKEDDSKLGFAISRTDEGFVFISSVIDGDENAPSTRSGLRDLYNEATKASRLLVVSRISNEKVLPWMVSSTGAIRCFDTVSLSQKLSLHKHAKVTIILHLFMWDRSLPSPSAAVPHKVVAKAKAASPPAMEYPPEVHLAKQPKEKQVQPLALHDEFEPNEYDEEEDDKPQAPVTMARDTAGENSFRFHEFSFANNWV